jgi:FixJ family two-component response regulator
MDAERCRVEPPVKILLVDDEPDVTRGLGWLLESVGIPSQSFDNARDFLAALEAHQEPACAVLDLRMPGVGGLELMERTVRMRPDVQIIFLSAHGDVPSAVRAMKLGAHDFLQKPFDPKVFLDCIQRCSARARSRYEELLSERSYSEHLERLSPRERDILDYLLQGASSKEIGRALQISHKTVEVHRANVLRKFGVATSRELEIRFGRRAGGRGGD